MKESDFIAKILAQREADEPRLVYADWLEEYGDQRASLIRLQCAKFEANQLGTQNPGVRHQLTRLLMENRHIWTTPLLKCGFEQIAFHRGFIDSVRATNDTLYANYEQLAARAPLLTNLSLRKPLDFPTSPRGLGRKWIDIGRLLQIEALSFGESNLAEDELVALADSSLRNSIKQLDVAWNLNAASQIEAALTRNVWPRLKMLDARGTFFGASLAKRVCQNANWPNIELVCVSTPKAEEVFCERFPGKVLGG